MFTTVTKEVAKMQRGKYISKIKRRLRDEYGFKPQPGSTDMEPLLELVAGKYPMVIDGKHDEVQIVNAYIYCGNFED